MGRILASVKIANSLDASNSLKCDAFVDTTAQLMVLPAGWKQKLGKLDSTTTIQFELVSQQMMNAEVCGPVRIQIEGFRPIHSEVVFVEMKQGVVEFEPLLGHIVLTQKSGGR